MEYFRLANGLEIPAVGSGTNSFAKVKGEVGSQYDGHTDEVLSAIKAGYITDRAELDRIVRAVLSGDVKYCPHGRPVSAVLGRRDLDKLFKRIV